VSTKTWEKEYCTSSEQASKLAKKGRKACLTAGMRKLQGLTKGNLKRHGLVANPDSDLAYMSVSEEDSGTLMHVFITLECPACRKYVTGETVGNMDCSACPVMDETGKRCYEKDGLLHVGLKTCDFEPARATLRRWWKKWYPGQNLPNFEPKLVPQEED
jgi:hypothetical protein